MEEPSTPPQWALSTPGSIPEALLSILQSISLPTPSSGNSKGLGAPQNISFFGMFPPVLCLPLGLKGATTSTISQDFMKVRSVSLGSATSHLCDLEHSASVSPSV